MGTGKNINDQKLLKKLYETMYHAMIHKDISTLDKVLDDSFILVHMTGMHQTKEQFLNAVKDGTLNYYSANTEHLSIHVYDDKADLDGQSKVSAAVFGSSRYTWPLEQRMQCQKAEGKWQITYSIASTY